MTQNRPLSCGVDEGILQHYNFVLNPRGQSKSISVGSIPLVTYEYEDVNGTAGAEGRNLKKRPTATGILYNISMIYLTDLRKSCIMIQGRSFPITTVPMVLWQNLPMEPRTM